MVDGLKPGQRKIMFACFKRNLKKEIKARTHTLCLSLKHCTNGMGEKSVPVH